MEAAKYFEQGYSCSESIVKEAIDLGIYDEKILPLATSFSGGMSSGCLCGAIAGAQIIIGALYGKENIFGNETRAREIAAQFIQDFKKEYPATCCKILSRGYEFNSKERKEHCKNIVDCCSKLLKKLTLNKV